MTQIQIRYEGELRTVCSMPSHSQIIQTDAPIDNHGKGEFFSPTDLLAAALGSCVLTLMGIAANRYKVDLGSVTATVEKTMQTTPPRRIASLTVTVHCPNTFPTETQQAIEKAGLSCPVHESLHPDIEQTVDFIWGE